MVLWGGGQGFCDHNTKALLIKLMLRAEVSKIVQNCVTSLMDNPKVIVLDSSNQGNFFEDIVVY